MFASVASVSTTMAFPPTAEIALRTDSWPVVPADHAVNSSVAQSPSMTCRPVITTCVPSQRALVTSHGDETMWS